jgi:predicted NBD/HSP70 family sugar kinase
VPLRQRGCLESKVSVNTLRDAMRDGHGPVSVKDCLQMALDGNIGAQRIIGAAAGQVGPPGRRSLQLF